jgi:hypothetical protein
MFTALSAALVCTVALLGVTIYFILGSIPLLILEHDTPKDGQFVRGFFNLYYRAAILTASATALSYVFAGRPIQAIIAAALALLAFVLRRRLIPAMDLLRVEIDLGVTSAITAFRRIHMKAIGINLVQLVLLIASLVNLSQQMK